uniref:Uncharacterized protein n=1 Tax=Brassica oleracea var. oleracea TaxID=109376 RepID=A0A0D3E1E7_BRAOL
MHIIIRTVNFSSQKIVTLETLTQRRLQLFLLEIPELLYIEVETAISRLLTSKLPTYPQHMLAHLKKQINGKEQLAMTQTTRSQPKKPIKIIPQYTASWSARQRMKA